METVSVEGSGNKGNGNEKTNGLNVGPAATVVVVVETTSAKGPHSIVDDGVRMVTTLSEHIPSRVACDISLLVII